ncbi:class I SAM-dependent methyltransferase [Alkalihalobacillus sp. 1P02AB]|uniref:class I SAM-dependent methyltransferase n=1 Tax=Alkalihalobacillus sp. 1P02AB TaxID=3132260 RepID=UPI0039A76623
MFSHYGPLCTELYNLTKPVGHSISGDIEFYFERLSGTKGRILEAAVGSGRFYIPMLEQGFLIEGIDNSPDMLSSCQKQCEERDLSPTLFKGDLSDFALPNNYEVIVVPSGSFCLIEDYQDSVNALGCFYDHLQPGGRLIIDLLLLDGWNPLENEVKTFPISNDEGILLESRAKEIDWVNQYHVTYLKYEKWLKGNLVASELQRFAVRWYGVKEFELLLQRIGFTNITYSADYHFKKEATTSSSIVTFEAIR